VSVSDRVSLIELSGMIRPPGDWLIAVLHAYFDYSGDDQDPGQKCVSVGGYLAKIETWEVFDRDWSRVLDEFGVEYLHMKEFPNPSGMYSSLSRDKQKEFFSALIGVIESLDMAAFGSTVRFADLRRFNAETTLALDAYSLALHECCLWMGHHCYEQIIEVFVDRFDGVTSKIALAENYCKSSANLAGDIALDYISVNALPKELGARKVRPLQAADFFAWELRREITHEDEWWGAIKPLTPKDSQFMSRIIWHAKRAASHSISFPYHHRQSHARLRRASPPIVANIWDYQALCEVNEVRGGVW
jgi:hypothetical protein